MKKWVIPTVTVIIFVQMLLLFIVFAIFKQGFHSDEVYNYTIANSSDSPSLTQTKDGDSLLNRWMDSEYFLDNISADTGHRFDYASTLDNSARDLNPPLQYMILHTICSFFPNTFSWYYCFVINAVAFIVSQIYLFRLVYGMTKKEIAGIAALVLFGFGTGAMDITIYMRIYALAVMFGVMFAYYSFQMYESRKETKIPVKICIGLFLTCLCGALTLHLFLMVAFCLTLCYTLFFLISKRYKYFFAHGLTCLAAVILSILVCPRTFAHVGGFNEEHSFSKVSYPFLTELRMYLYTLTSDLFGIHVLRHNNNYFLRVLVVLGVVLIFMIPIVFLVKKEKWFLSAVEKLKGKISRIKAKSSNFCFPLIPLFVSIIVSLFVVVKWTSYLLMGEYSNRYLFLLYPLTVAFAVSLAYFLLQLLTERFKVTAGILLGICVILTVWTHFNQYSKAYLFLHEEEGVTFQTIQENPEAREIIVLWDPEVWILVCMAPELYKTDRYFATRYTEYENPDVFRDFDPSKPYYLLVDQHYVLPEGKTLEEAKEDLYYMNAEKIYTEEEILSFYKSSSVVEDVEYVGTDEAFGRRYKIYQLIPDVSK